MPRGKDWCKKMIDTAKENLCVNKLISEKTEIVFVEGDMIIPDSKPDVLNTISTSGIACIYKKELQDGKIRFDGSVQTYVMYVPEGMEEGVRGLNTTLDFFRKYGNGWCNIRYASSIKN